jgi:hypothetical protein
MSRLAFLFPASPNSSLASYIALSLSLACLFLDELINVDANYWGLANNEEKHVLHLSTTPILRHIRCMHVTII